MRRSFSNVAVPTKTIGALAAAATAAAISALWVEHRARKAERDTPPVGRFVEVDGVPLHYVDKGTGPAVVLLHGNAVLLQDFIASGLIDRLAERYRVIAFDRPGYGHSGRPRDRLWTATAQAALIRQALAQIGVDQPVVVGHSWGTLVALGMAADGAADLRGLVLVSGYYYPTARVDAALAAPAALPIVGDVLRYTVSPLTGRLLLRRTVEAMFSPLPTPADFFNFVSREMILRPVQIKAEAEDAAFMIPAAARFSALYRDLKMPVSIFAGVDDKVIDPQANSVRLHREITHSTLVIARGAGHMVHYAVPAQIVEAIDLMSAGQSVETGDSNAAIDETSAAERLPVTPAEA
ncbi:alpha/beta hydrolase [Paraburkholderia strydomiana]|jgi:pimeloyl-ACP methyl ester carboxylesterase|uniref:alpha/beta fold hydrolase n=1 Tax=Paraburkholderia strydomiana TaxID=1245417 RepID=UPI0038B88E97